MTEQELRDLIRATVRRQLAERSRPRHVAAAAIDHHPSQDVYVTLVNVGEACLIEPTVPCNHCNYCKSHGH